ncbi:MAG TPA: peptidylprolyl isomerase [Candidatus Saccharimonadales bacterium]|nr:peptidylprolyl isomerase [Candidatus Saccharimonadales bacterium]
MKHKVKKLLAKRPFRRRKSEESLQEAIHNIPRITNETVAEHREEVLGSARKYIYPLQHSAHRIVIISTIIFGLLTIAFFVYCVLALYRFNSTSTFIYRVTQVIPFPVAKAGPDFVAYENYLFELRHYMHYYQTQQQVDFNSDSGRQQLAAFRKVALESVINDAYTKQLAAKHKVHVADQELNDQVALLRNQNRLGSSDAVFEDVLKEFWNWSIADFKRELKMQMLSQKVVSTLDDSTHARARNVFAQLSNGGDFAALAKQYSDEAGAKESGGDYGFAISKTNRVLPPQVIDMLFKLKPSETSAIVETPLGLEILRLREADGSTVRASHIFFAFKKPSTYIDPLKKEKKPRHFIGL